MVHKVEVETDKNACDILLNAIHTPLFALI